MSRARSLRQHGHVVPQDSLTRLLPSYETAPDIRRASLMHVAARFDIEQRCGPAPAVTPAPHPPFRPTACAPARGHGEEV